MRFGQRRSKIVKKSAPRKSESIFPKVVEMPIGAWPNVVWKIPPRLDFAAVRETACRIRPAMTAWPSEADGGMISG